ncbi:Threonine--tRNA ligase [Tetrabaena socialis]|uniref:Threonine--tRNA ligase n=1 Tax=Tetrabaena socialis TaxID=47790 RepID=A0A2J7ZWQ1_9CHLO|nr:Threonine--tRNA ligase [Tetrabaena socialis]|eukprot:PNH04675.1 Threonine--tRNA ligase [Tetrabaena socialis]
MELTGAARPRSRCGVNPSSASSYGTSKGCGGRSTTAAKAGEGRPTVELPPRAALADAPTAAAHVAPPSAAKVMQSMFMELKTSDESENLLRIRHSADLWKTSGHLDFYKENMYEQMKVEDETYQLRPMNCPFHISVYKDGYYSYRDLPLRLAELGTVYRFDVSYIDASATRQRPIMIHRAIFGSLERFFGILIENYMGAFPMWLAPVQVRLLTVNDTFADYAHGVAAQMRKAGIRVEVVGQASIGKLIRNAEKAKIPVICVVGAKEAEAGSLSVRAWAYTGVVRRNCDELASEERENQDLRAGGGCMA